MDVRLPDGTIIQGVPDSMSRADLTAKLKANGHDVSGLGSSGVDQIPTGSNLTIPSTSASAPDGSKDNLLGRAFGKYEVPVAMATGMAGGLIGNIAGVAKSVASGKYGTPEGVQQGQQTAADVAHALTYKPRSETGNYLTQQVGNAIDKSGIMGIPLPALNDLSMGISSASPAAKVIAGAAGNEIKAQAGSVTNKLADMVKPAEKPMIGMGAASTDVNMLRAMRAADLPVPINLTKGQTSRTFEQQRFERETAKLPKEGAPIRQRMEEQNQQMLQNFDAFADMTGAEQPSLRAVGQVVTKAVVDKMAKAKGEINQAYNQARDAGQMTEPVAINGISDYVNKNRSAAKNAPILDAVESELKRLDPAGTGMLSINDLEELRKMTGRLSQPGTPNSVYGQDVKGLIDASIGDKGGPMYQQARRMYENYSNEFKNTAVIDRMLRNKPGTKDRAVAYEDVFNHSILGGSLDDVRAVRRTLQTAGTEGEQAWKELQGQTVKHIKETITSNVSRDSLGNPIVSPDKLNKLVRNLDADGKLDFVFGKKGAEQIRDMNDLAKDVYTSPPGAVNSSNTASVLIGLLDTAVSGVSGVPLPIGTAINYGVKRVKSNALQKLVGEALNPNPLKNAVQGP